MMLSSTAEEGSDSWHSWQRHSEQTSSQDFFQGGVLTPENSGSLVVWSHSEHQFLPSDWDMRFSDGDFDTLLIFSLSTIVWYFLGIVSTQSKNSRKILKRYTTAIHHRDIYLIWGVSISEKSQNFSILSPISYSIVRQRDTKNSLLRWMWSLPIQKL